MPAHSSGATAASCDSDGGPSARSRGRPRSAANSRRGYGVRGIGGRAVARCRRTVSQYRSRPSSQAAQCLQLPTRAADADDVADLDVLPPAADRADAADDLVPGHAGDIRCPAIPTAWVQVRVADAAVGDVDLHVARTGARRSMSMATTGWSARAPQAFGGHAGCILYGEVPDSAPKPRGGARRFGHTIRASRPHVPMSAEHAPLADEAVLRRQGAEHPTLLFFRMGDF